MTIPQILELVDKQQTIRNTSNPSSDSWKQANNRLGELYGLLRETAEGQSCP